MLDLLFLALFLLTCFGLGLPFLRFILDDVDDASLIAAPVLGFAFVSVVTTLAYRHGVAPTTCVAVQAAVAAILLVREFRVRLNDHRKRIKLLQAAGVVLAVLFLAILPKWTGGWQFAAFQGNHFDHINYMSFATAARQHSYIELKSLDGEARKRANFLTMVSEHPDSRWAVSIVCAGFSGILNMRVTQASYAYLVGLQVIFLFAALYLLVQLIGRLDWRIWCTGAAVSLGFGIQYVFDINAWSELAALPVATLSFALFLRHIARLGQLKHPISQSRNAKISIANGVLFGSLLIVYPEMTIIFLGGLGASALLALWKRGGGVAVCLSCLYAAGVALLVGSLYVENTFGFFAGQIQMANDARVDWYWYFQKYLLGSVADPLQLAISRGGLGSLSSLPVILWTATGAGLSTLGMYFLLPGDLWALNSGLFAIYFALLCGLICTAILGWVEICRRGRSADFAQLFLLGVFCMSVVIVGVGLSGRFWVAGKVLSMIQPLLMIAAMVPFLINFSPRIAQVPALVLIVSSLALGVARPIAAATPTGIHYGFPYPSIQNATRKEIYSWNFEGEADRLRSCRGIVLDVDDPILERYAHVFLSGLGGPWSSTQDVDADWDKGPNLGMQEPVANPDCAVSSKPSATYPGLTVFQLRRG